MDIKSILFKTTIVWLSLCLAGISVQGQSNLYQQNFAGQNGKGIDGNGTDTSGINWQISVSNGSFSATSDYFMVKSETFEAQDTDGKVTWISDTINISGYSNLQFNWDAKASGDFEANADIFQVSAYVDGIQYTLKQTTVDESISGDPMFFGNTRLNSNLKAFSEAIGQTGSECYIKVLVDVNAGGELCGWDSLSLTGTSSTSPEPANQPTQFQASASAYNQVNLSWTDASAGNQQPDGYLIKASNTSNISQPTDGNDPSTDSDLSNGSAVVKVDYSNASQYSFTGLQSNSVYHFQIWSYTNSGGNIDFLTNPAGPNDTAATPLTKVIVKQDFDQNKEWAYTSSVNFFSHTNTNVYPNADGWTADGFYGLIQEGDATNMTQYTKLSDTLLGVSDLDDEGDFGTSGDAIFTFDYIDLSAFSEVAISFAYDVECFDNADKVAYKIYKNNNSLVKNQRIAGGSQPGTTEGMIRDTVSNNLDSVRLELVLKQNGASDYAAFDQFKVKNTATLKDEPTNHPSGFSATNTNQTSARLNWCDVSSDPTPDGYVILGKSGNQTFKTVTDNIPVSTDTNWSDKDAANTVQQGIQQYVFSGLTTGQNYAFTIYPYTNNGSEIDYKTDNAPTTQVGVQNFIAKQSFEGSGSWQYQTSPTTCNNGPNSYWQVRQQADSIQPVSGNKLFGFKDLTGGPCGKSGLNNTLIFDTIGYATLTPYENVRLSFQYQVFQYDKDDQIQYELIYNGQSNGKHLLFEGASDSSTQSCNRNWVNHTVDIPDSVYNIGLKLHVQQTGTSDFAAVDYFRLTGDTLGSETKKWAGNGNNDNWGNTTNWEPNGIPQKRDSVILDHTYVSKAYEVKVDGSQSYQVGLLNIDPQTGDSITLRIPQSNSQDQALVINQPSAPLTINDKAKLVNASASKGGSVLNLADSLVIKNGGTYRHQTTSDHADLIEHLSQKSGTEKGNFVFDVPNANYPVKLADAHLGNLTMSANNNQTVKYEITGSQDAHIRKHLTMGSQAQLGLTAYNAQLQIGGSFKLDSASRLIVADSLPGYFQVKGAKSINKSAYFTLKDSGYKTGFGSWGIKEAAILTRDGSNAIQLSNDLQVTKALSLSNGTIQIGAHNLTLAKGASINGGAKDSYVKIDSSRNGKFRRRAESNGFVPFPVGFESYAPVELKCASCTNETFTVRVQNNLYQDPEQATNLQTTNAVTQTWSVVPNQSVNDVKLRFSWERTQESNFDITNAFIIDHEKGVSSQWGIDSTGVNGNALRSATTSTRDLSPDQYYFGVVDAGFPFPFDLNDFRVKKNGEQSALLEWETGSEKNARLFRIQHHTDQDRNWTVIGTKQAQGTTTQATSYNFLHDSAGYGKHYYRLKQVDLDGSVAFSPTQTITFEQDPLSVEPRYQLADNQLLLTIQSTLNKNFRLRLFSTSGKQVVNRNIDVRNGLNEIRLKDWQSLKPGVYLLSLEQGDKRYTKKLIKF